MTSSVMAAMIDAANLKDNEYPSKAAEVMDNALKYFEPDA